MEIKITPEQGFQYIEIGGRLDAVSSGEVQEELVRLSESGDKKMVVCLEKVDYIASSGLRAFLAVAKKLGSEGFIRFCCMQPSVKEVFTISGFNTIFSVYESKEEAMQ